MRRPSVNETLIITLLGGGLALAALGGGAGHSLVASGVAMTAGAAAWAAISLSRLRSKCLRVTETLNNAGSAKLVEPEAIAIAAPDELGAALGDALAAARRSAVDAELRARELDIRLKIATAERDHAESIIYNISDAVVVTDTAEDVVLTNESAAKTFKFDLESASHTPVRNLVRDPKLVEMIRQTRRAGANAGTRVFEHQLTSGDTTKTYKITLSNIADKREAAGEAKPAGVVAVLHDVTHEREIAQLKNNFVSSVSHELRTPLASIKAYVELLIDGEAHDEKTKREFYDVIQNEANRLGRLIDNILNISKIESGLIQVDQRPLGLTAIVHDAIEIIAPQATRKSIKINANLTPAEHRTSADRDMIYQAVLNLLSNAVKFTPEGGEVRIETGIDEARRKLVTRVTDTGVGIPDQDLPFIFDKFFRAETSSRMAQGTGLGLSLVKHIVETVHGGRVFVESETGKGSTFGFELELVE